MAAQNTLVTIDHERIRRWSEARGAKPTRVRGTGGRGDVGMIRLDFPGYSGEGKLDPITWDQWFDKFDAQNLALIFRQRTPSGAPSHFNKLVKRDSPEVVERLGQSVKPAGRFEARRGAGAGRRGAAARAATPQARAAQKQGRAAARPTARKAATKPARGVASRSARSGAGRAGRAATRAAKARSAGRRAPRA